METTVRVAHKRIGPGEPVFLVAKRAIARGEILSGERRSGRSEARSDASGTPEGRPRPSDASRSRGRLSPARSIDTKEPPGLGQYTPAGTCDYDYHYERGFCMQPAVETCRCGRGCERHRWTELDVDGLCLSCVHGADCAAEGSSPETAERGPFRTRDQAPRGD